MGIHGGECFLYELSQMPLEGKGMGKLINSYLTIEEIRKFPEKKLSGQLPKEWKDIIEVMVNMKKKHLEEKKKMFYSCNDDYNELLKIKEFLYEKH